jgi:hypothetical protein
VELYSYQAPAVPGEVRVRNAEQILPASDLDLFGGNITAFADLFRYHLLHMLGGWWVDTDVYCLTAQLPQASKAWAPEGGNLLNNAILKFPAGDPTCAELARLARERAGEPARWGALGPALLTEVLGSVAVPEHGGTQDGFYPLHWLEAHYVWLPERRADVDARLSGACFLHLWMKALIDCGIDLQCAPPDGSWLAAVAADEAWPGPKAPWHDWRTRRAITRYHEAPSVQRKLARIEAERLSSGRQRG